VLSWCHINQFTPTKYNPEQKDGNQFFTSSVWRSTMK